MKAKITPKRIASAAVWMVLIPAVVIAQALRGTKEPRVINKR